MRDIEKSHHLENVIRETQRRRLIQSILKTTSRTLIVSSLIAVALILADRVFGYSVSSWWLMVTISAGLPIGIGLGIGKRLSKYDAAYAIDDAFELKNRLTTAVDLQDQRHHDLINREQPTTDAFAELVRVDAEATAGKIEPKRLYPLRWDSSLTWAVLCCGFFATGIVYLPDISDSIFANPAAEELSASTARARSAAQAIQDAAAELQRRSGESHALKSDGATTADGPEDDTQEVFKTLENLSNQLTRSSDNDKVEDGSTPPPQTDPDQRVAEAADALDTFARNLDDAAEVDRKTSESILERFSGLQNENKDDATEPNALDEDLRKIVEALKRGDAQQATKEIAAADRKLRDQSPSERKQAAEALRKLADQIEKKSAPGNDNDAADGASNEIGNQSDETGPQNENEPNNESDAAGNTQPDDKVDAASSEGDESSDPETARQMEDYKRTRKIENESEKKANEHLRDMAKQMRQWADDLKENKPPNDAASKPDENERSQQDSNESANTNTSKEQSTEENAKGTEQTQSSNEPNTDKSTKEEGGAQQQTKPSDKVNSQGDREDKGERTKPSSNKTAEQNSENSNPTSATDKTKNEDHSQEKVESTRTEEEPTGSSADQKSGEQKRILKPEDESSAPSDAARRLQEVLKNIESVRKRAGKRREISEEARRQARRLIEQMTPEERQELERWASKNLTQDQQPEPKTGRDAAGNEGGSTLGANDSQSGEAGDSRPFDYKIENLDARPDSKASATKTSDDERVLSEWPRNDSEAGNENGEPKISSNAPTGRSLSPSEIARASRALQRALQEEAIAPRYRELLKRWSKQLSQQLKSESGRNEPTEQSAGSKGSSPDDSK